jgi:hypothetical protein
LRASTSGNNEEAEAALAESGVRAKERTSVRDQVAAQLILQAWFDDTKEDGPPRCCLTRCLTPRRRCGHSPTACAAPSRSMRSSSGSIRAAPGSPSGLAQLIEGDHAVGFIDVSFYRDDFSRKGLKPEVKRTELPFEVEGATIVLIDDVLYTGRSVRAAVNELFDYGRPARVELAVLVDRGGRELPIEATYAGVRLAVAPQPLDRAVAQRRRQAARSAPRQAVRNPQLNAAGDLTHLLTLEGLPAGNHPARARHRSAVRVDRRARGEEGPAAPRAARCSTCSSRTRRAPARRSRSPRSGCRPT